MPFAVLYRLKVPALMEGFARSFLHGCAALATSLAVLAATGPLLAAAPHPDRAKALADLRDQNFEALPQPQFEAYFTKIEFPLLTEPKDPKGLPLARSKFRTIFFLSGKGGEPHKVLNKLTLDAMKEAVSNPAAPPVVKVNAMYLIGQLNEEEPATGNPPVPAKPLIDALGFMNSVAKPSKDGSGKYSAEVKAIALCGIQRHVELSRASPLPDAARAEVSKTLLAIVQQTTPAQGVSVEGHGWMRQSAAQSLILLGDEPMIREVVVALGGAIKQEDVPLDRRCRMASLLGDIKYSAPNQVDFASLAKNMADLAIDVGRNGATLVEKGPKDAKKWRPLKERLNWLQWGLAGHDPKKPGGLLAAAEGTKHKQEVEAAHGLVKELLAAVESGTPKKLNQILDSATGSSEEKPKKPVGPIAGSAGSNVSPPAVSRKPTTESRDNFTSDKKDGSED